MTETRTDMWGREIPSGLSHITVDFTELPVIDFAPMFSANVADRREVALALREACINVGFFYLSNHGVPQDLIDATFDMGARFMALPVEEKMQIAKSKTPGYGGYSYMGELGESRGQSQLQEGFNMNLELPADDPYVVEGRTFYNPNSWPARPEGFREQFLSYYAAMETLSARLLRAFALALDLDEHYFDSMTDKPIALMRYINYPHQDDVVDDQRVGLRAHTDYECFTILAQSPGQTALQVLNGKKEWISAPPIPGTFVVNIGDQMAYWTNDLFASTFHRVINQNGSFRASIPFFYGTNSDTVMAPLETCVSAEHPAKYEPITAGEYIQNRISSAYGYDVSATKQP